MGFLPKSFRVRSFLIVLIVIFSANVQAEPSREQIIEHDMDLAMNQGESSSQIQPEMVQLAEENPVKTVSKKEVLVTRRHTFDIGTEVYHNRYTERDVGVFITGAMTGYYGRYMYRPAYGNFLNNSIINVYRLEGRFSQGKVDYKGSAPDRRTDKTYEIRGIVGKEYILSDQSRVTPYFGFGYRYLLDPSNGHSSTNDGINFFAGYDRKSHYFYIPIGATVDIPAADNTEISLNVEYDYFLQGTQKSYLSDIDQFNSSPSFDVSDHQDKGFGIRGSIRLLKHFDPIDIYMEPFIRFWNIEDSKVDQTVILGNSELGLEPHNTTTEIGSKFGMQF